MQNPGLSIITFHTANTITVNTGSILSPDKQNPGLSVITFHTANTITVNPGSCLSGVKMTQG